MGNFIKSLAEIKKYYIYLTFAMNSCCPIMRLIVSHSTVSHGTHVENLAGCYLHLDVWHHD